MTNSRVPPETDFENADMDVQPDGLRIPRIACKTLPVFRRDSAVPESRKEPPPS